MAKPPKCELCGQMHWDREPHKFEGEGLTKEKIREAVKAIINKDVRPQPEVTLPTAEIVEADKPVSAMLDKMSKSNAECVKEWCKSHPEAYREYMRAYMKKRRASVKARPDSA